MSNGQKREQLLQIYRDPAQDPAKGEDVFLIEVLGEPVLALKQMKAEPFRLSERSNTAPGDKK